jgi:hypothetical protein
MSAYSTFYALFLFFLELNETAESENEPCISMSSDAEDIFADTDALDFDQV